MVSLLLPTELLVLAKSIKKYKHQIWIYFAYFH